MLHSISPLVHVCLRPTHWAFDTGSTRSLCAGSLTAAFSAPVSGMHVQILQILSYFWCRVVQLLETPQSSLTRRVSGTLEYFYSRN